jgi:hypothetical protein
MIPSFDALSQMEELVPKKLETTIRAIFQILVSITKKEV